MSKRNSGFGLVIVPVVIVVVAVLAVGGWFLWQKYSLSQMVIGLNGTCTIPMGGTGVTDEGRLYLGQSRAFTICIPDGWTLTNDSAGTLVALDASSLTYKAGTPPVITAGTVPDTAALRFYLAYGPAASTAASYASTGFASVRSVAADNVTGTEYQKAVSDSVPGSYPNGTEQTSYYFPKQDNSVRLDYSVLPNDTDQSQLLFYVAHTVHFN